MGQLRRVTNLIYKDSVTDSINMVEWGEMKVIIAVSLF